MKMLAYALAEFVDVPYFISHKTSNGIHNYSRHERLEIRLRLEPRLFGLIQQNIFIGRIEYNNEHNSVVLHFFTPGHRDRFLQHHNTICERYERQFKVPVVVFPQSFLKTKSKHKGTLVEQALVGIAAYQWAKKQQSPLSKRAIRFLRNKF